LGEIRGRSTIVPLFYYALVLGSKRLKNGSVYPAALWKLFSRKLQLQAGSVRRNVQFIRYIRLSEIIEKGIPMQQQEQPALCRTAMEVQRAHDLLGALLKQIVRSPGLSELPVMDVEQAFVLGSRYAVLCWLLGQPNREFSDYLDSLEQLLLEQGIEFTDTGRLHYPEGVGSGRRDGEL
jgi:hypothetical protein